MLIANGQAKKRRKRPATLSLVATWNIVAYKGWGLPDSSALDFALRLRNMVCTTRWRKDVGGFRQWQHPPHSTRKTLRLWAIRGTASPLLPKKCTGTALAKKAALVWLSCKTSRRWADQGPASGHTVSNVAQTNWRRGQSWLRHTWKPLPGQQIFGHAPWRKDWV